MNYEYKSIVIDDEFCSRNARELNSEFAVDWEYVDKIVQPVPANNSFTRTTKVMIILRRLKVTTL